VLHVHSKNAKIVNVLRTANVECLLLNVLMRRAENGLSVVRELLARVCRTENGLSAVRGPALLAI